jgi:hypothetical protein
MTCLRRNLSAVSFSILFLNPSSMSSSANILSHYPAGARWYHLRRVFHNWSDPDCRRVLSQTKAAFTPGFSTLLIQENVLPNQGCPKRGALGDIAMMQHTGMERNEDQWRQLLSSAGFEIVRIWRAELGTTAIIEADLQDEDALCATNGSAAQAHGHARQTEASAGPKNGSEAATDAFAVTPNRTAASTNGAAITTDKPDETHSLPITVNDAAGIQVV